MMKKCRQLHLWIGLLTSFLILIEAVTGLFMIEPWLLGENRPSTGQRVQLEKTKTGETFGREAGEYGKPVEGEASEGIDFRKANNSNNLMGFIKGLHSGRIGSTNLSVFLDIAAIALIILTTTGIILSIKTLKSQIITKKKN
ncbi:MAG: PepSY-associated TM helix domain-containing protein [Eubacteriales bacterium]